MDLAAQQFINRLADSLALDVPERDLDAGEHAHQRSVGPQGVARAIGLAPQSLDMERVHALDIAGEDVLDHRHHGLGPEGRAIDLADTADIVIGGELDEDEITPAPTGRRVADDKNLEIADLHLNCSLPSPQHHRRGEETMQEPAPVTSSIRGSAKPAARPRQTGRARYRVLNSP